MKTLKVVTKATSPDANLSHYADAAPNISAWAVTTLESVTSRAKTGGEVERQYPLGKVGVRGPSKLSAIRRGRRSYEVQAGDGGKDSLKTGLAKGS